MKLFITFWLILYTLLPCDAQSQCHPELFFLSSLRQELVSALALPSSAPFPCLCYDPLLPANARYASDTITLGTLQSDYHSRGDTISLIYHEYVHFLQLKAHRFLLCEDSSGQVIQIQTGEFYVHTPDSLEIAHTLKGIRKSQAYHELDSLAQAQLVAQLQQDLSKPQWLPFVYAPSELALAELEAYHFQLNAEHESLYLLSSDARAAILRRIQQLEDTYLRRKEYEARMKRRADGCLK